MNYPCSSSSDSLMHSIMHAARALEAQLEEGFATVGLSGARYGVLDQLVRAGEPLSLGDLAARLSCVRSNMTQLMDRLEADGLVRRVADPSDRRSIRAEITPSGKALQARGAEQLAKVSAAFEASIPKPDRALLKKALEVAT